jgi:hypothetical protein
MFTESFTLTGFGQRFFLPFFSGFRSRIAFRLTVSRSTRFGAKT